MNEKRRDTRKETDIIVKYLLKNDESSLYSGSFSKNLSQAGMCINTTNKITSGDIIKLHFALPNSSLINDAEAKIVWVNEKVKNKEFQMGFEFTEIEADVKQQLDNWCKLP